MSVPFIVDLVQNAVKAKNKNAIADKIIEFAKAVDLGEFDKLTGYRVDEHDTSNENNFSDFDSYSARQII